MTVWVYGKNYDGEIISENCWALKVQLTTFTNIPAVSKTYEKGKTRSDTPP